LGRKLDGLRRDRLKLREFHEQVFDLALFVRAGKGSDSHVSIIPHRGDAAYDAEEESGYLEI